MTTEATLQALLAPLADGGCWPVANTAATIVYPYIVFYEIVSVPEMLDEGGVTAKRFQVDCFARSYGAAKSLRKSVKDAVSESSMVSAYISSMDGDYNEVAKDFRAIAEFTIWSTE